MESDRSDSSGPITQRLYSLGAAAAGATDTRGKHRIQAELKRIEQEARFLEVSVFMFILFCYYFLGSSIIPRTMFLCFKLFDSLIVLCVHG